MPEVCQAWQQRKGESARAYRAALAYFRMGAVRSTAAVAWLLDLDCGYIERLSVRHGWVERAQVYDAAHAGADTATRTVVLGADAYAEAERWLERVRLAREQEWEVSRDLVAKAREMLAQPLETTRWSLRDAAKFLELAVKLTEQATQQASGGADADGDGELTVRVEYADDGHAEA